MYLEDITPSLSQLAYRTAGLDAAYPIPVRYLPMSPGDWGVSQTLDEMVALVRSAARDPLVKMSAVLLAGDPPPFNRTVLFGRLYDSLRLHYRYVNDTRGVEELWAPSIHAARHIHSGKTFGDCDDLAIWSLSVARSVGFNGRFAVSANGRGTPRLRYNHVWGEVEVAPGIWKSFDFLSPNAPKIRMQWRYIEPGEPRITPKSDPSSIDRERAPSRRL